MRKKGTLPLIFCAIGASAILLTSCGADTSTQHFSCNTDGYRVVLDDDPRDENEVFKLIHIYHNSQIVGRIYRSNNAYGSKGELVYYPPSGPLVIDIRSNVNETGTITNMKCNGKLIEPTLNGEESDIDRIWEYDFGTFKAGITINMSFDCSFTEIYYKS